jgi:hypothetical protein
VALFESSRAAEAFVMSSLMVTKWLHIDTDVGDPWVLPIWSAVNDAIAAKKVGPITKEESELGLHISTRLDILPYVVSRINDTVAKIYEAISDFGDEHVFTEGHQGYAMPFRNKRDLVHILLADIDALLFETNSVCELMTAFFEKLYKHVGINLKKNEAGLRIKKIIESKGFDTKWFQNLDNHRNFFIHEVAPYVAIDVSKGRKEYDLLIMKENLKSFKDSSKFVRLSELNKMVQGFISARHTLQQHLIELIQKAGS